MKSLSLSLVFITLIRIHLSGQAHYPGGTNTAIIKNGFFIEHFLGYNFFTTERYVFENGFDGKKTTTKGGIGTGIKLGNKWYSKSKSKYIPGFQMIWLNNGLYSQSGLTLSPLNPGFTNTFSLNQFSSIELNINAGFGIWIYEVFFLIEKASGGISINPEFRYQYKRMTIGIDYLRLEDLSKYRDHVDAFNFNIGLKF